MMMSWTAGVLVDTPLKMLALRLMASSLPPPPQYIRNIIYNSSILVRPEVEDRKKPIIISLQQILILNARHDCGQSSSESKR